MVKKTHQVKKTPQIKSNRRKTLTIVSAVILVLTYTTRDLLKEKTKDLSDSLQSAETLYRTGKIESSLSIQNIAYRQLNQINQINQINTIPMESERDYSDIIRSDVLVAQQVLGDLNLDFDNVSRFLDKLPSGGTDDLRQARDQIHKDVDKINQQVGDLLKPSPEHNWVRAVGVKLGVIMSAWTEIPVLLLGDAVLTRANRFKEAADRAYQFIVWLSYLLYTTGVALALYANLSGGGGLGEGE